MSSEAVQLRSWSPVESNVQPLILAKDPSFFDHLCCSFAIPTDHVYYQDFLKLLDCWFVNVKKPSSLKFSAVGKYNLEELDPPGWYILDLRKQPDLSLTNVIAIEHLSLLPTAVQSQLLYNIYSKVKGLVVFADTIDDIPNTLVSLSVLGLTYESSPTAIRSLCMKGCYHTLHDKEGFRGFRMTAMDPMSLIGYHRFFALESFVYWPCMD